MMKLDTGNVLLKPSHLRQMNAWLKRPMRLGERMGGLDLTLSLQRVGGRYEARAQVRDSAGSFDCRTRDRNLRDAVRDVTALLASRLHDQCIQQQLIQ